MIDNQMVPNNYSIVRPQNRKFEMLTGTEHIDHYEHNAYENYSEDLLVRVLYDRQLFIDIGAHHGFYSLLQATENPDTRVMAFEPLPQNCEIIRKNLELNKLKNVEVYESAVSDQNATREFVIASRSSRGSFYGHHLSPAVGTLQVNTVALDSIVKADEYNSIVIKIDTEGHEMAVLAGMQDLLKGTADIRLLVEFNPQCLVSAGHQPVELLNTLDRLGFTLYRIDDELRFVYKLSKQDFADWASHFGEGNYSKDFFNILCIKKSRSLNVCFFSHSSNLVGAERSMAEMVKELINDSGAIVTVCLPFKGELTDKLVETGAAILPVDYYWWCDWQMPGREEIDRRLVHSYVSVLHTVNDKLKLINPDVIVTNTMVIPWGAVAAAMLNKPHAWFVREFGELDFGFNFFRPFTDILTMIDESSNKILTVSKAVKDTLFPVLDDARVLPIYSHFDVSVEEVKEMPPSYFSRAGAVRLVIAGSVIASKGQKEAVLAVKELISRGRDVELLIVGTVDEEYGEELNRIISTGNVEGYVRMLGWQNTYPIIRQAHIVLTCSRHEAFGRVTAEAMMLKKPVIGTNTGGTAELIKEGFNGFLYEPGDYRQLADKIEYFIDHRQKIAEFGSNGYEYASTTFTRENFGAKTYGVLKGIKDEENPINHKSNRFINDLNISSIADLENNIKRQAESIEYLAGRAALVPELEKQVVALDRLTGTQEQRIRRLESSLLDKNNRQKQTEKRLEDSNYQLNEYRAAYDAVTGSLSWRMAKKLHTVINSVLPLGSKRRLLAGRVLFRLAHPGQLVRYLSPPDLINYFRFMSKTDTAEMAALLYGAPVAATAPKIAFGITDPAALTSLDQVETLKFEEVSNPLLSIVVRAGGKWQHTYLCLQSILKNNLSFDYDVAVAVDQPDGSMVKLMQKMQGVTVINRGDLTADAGVMRAAARVSKGKSLLFIDAGIYLLEDSIETLVATLNNDDKAGIVGPKIRSYDGRLQSAGCMVVKEDGRYILVDLGYGQDHDNYEYNFVKEVDCFKSCFLMRRDLLDKSPESVGNRNGAGLNGFDAAFTARSLGYGVIYQPEAAVVNWSTPSSDRQVISSENASVQKWLEVLHIDLLSGRRDLFLGRDRTQKKQHLLFIEYNLPTWDKDAGSLSIFTYLKLLLELGFKITFLPEALQRTIHYTLYLQQLGIEVIYGHFDYNDWIQENGSHIDVTFIARPPLPLKYLDSLREYTPSRIIYYNIDLHYLREARRYEVEKNEAALQESMNLKEIEFRIINSVDVTVTPSSAEKAMLREELPHRTIEDIPVYIYEVFPADHINIGFESREGILFLGGFLHVPNIDAVLWFVREVYPLILKKLPGIKLTVAGSDPSPEILGLDSENITVTGYVSDLTPYFSTARAFVAPIRYGAGIKGKIITSMAYGLPVVTTTIGNEGLDLLDGRDAFVSDDAQEFADKVVRLYQDRELWMEMATRALQFVKANYSKAVAIDKLLNVLGMKRCTVCGSAFIMPDIQKTDNLRETHVCMHCGAIPRYQDVASVILQVMKLKHSFLKVALADLAGASIYVLESYGAIYDTLKGLPGFTYSEFFEDVAPGDFKGNIRCENVEKLSFQDNCFDIVISQDIFEHVNEPETGFREIYRILKPGGYHITTIPYYRSLEKNRKRAVYKDGEVSYLLPPMYHGDPIRSGGGLVYTDFGMEIFDTMRVTGFEVTTYETELLQYAGGYNCVFICRKI